MQFNESKNAFQVSSNPAKIIDTSFLNYNNSLFCLLKNKYVKQNFDYTINYGLFSEQSAASRQKAINGKKEK